MKKKFVTAMATALVVGAASTTFAAANPFSDVPAGHWAYDAVTQLAADGIIEGYGDGTFLGNRNITRYEMAQMIAKAMAKNPTGADKAALDRLSAEFSEELSNLGVRVSNLEKYADKVKWTGEMRYRYISDRLKYKDGSKDRKNDNWVHFRLFPTAEVNKHWQVKARMTATYRMNNDTSGDFKLTWAKAEGNYGKLNINLGKMIFYDNVGDGLTLDTFFSGAQVKYGSKWKVNLEAGRFNLSDTFLSYASDDNAANYQGGEVTYDTGSKFFVGASYRHFGSDAFRSALGYNRRGKTQKSANIWGAGIGYKFDKNVKLFYSYASNTRADELNKSWTAQLSYKGSNRKANSWGAWAAYRYIGSNVSFAPTYDTFTNLSDKKGFEIGAEWSPLNNTLTSVQYFGGKSLLTDENTQTIFGRVSWFF